MHSHSEEGNEIYYSEIINDLIMNVKFNLRSLQGNMKTPVYSGDCPLVGHTKRLTLTPENAFCILCPSKSQSSFRLTRA